jgi:virginiamycin A acetyltransferase
MRAALKHVAFGLATLAVLPNLISYWVRSLILGRERAFEGSSQLLALIPGLVGLYLRRAFLCRVLDECHPSVTVEFGVLFSTPSARLGERVYIGPRCHLGLAHIGDDVLLAAGVHVPSGAHVHGTDDQGPIRDQRFERTEVKIGRGCWIGSAAVVMADVDEDTVVGAGAVVTRALPARVVAAGVPARVVRAR